MTLELGSVVLIEEIVLCSTESADDSFGRLDCVASLLVETVSEAYSLENVPVIAVLELAALI